MAEDCQNATQQVYHTPGAGSQIRVQLLEPAKP